MTQNRKKLLNGGIVACLLASMVASLAWYIWVPRAAADAAGGKVADFVISDAYALLSKWATIGFGGLAAALTALRIRVR